MLDGILKGWDTPPTLDEWTEALREVERREQQASRGQQPIAYDTFRAHYDAAYDRARAHYNAAYDDIAVARATLQRPALTCSHCRSSFQYADPPPTDPLTCPICNAQWTPASKV